MASLKLYKTTSRFKRQFKRDVYDVLLCLRSSEMQKHNPVAVIQLIKNTLRQRSGHYMKKSIRSCYAQIPSEMKQLEK